MTTARHPDPTACSPRRRQAERERLAAARIAAALWFLAGVFTGCAVALTLA